MNEPFSSKPPRQDLTPEEKTRMARRFRRRAKLADLLVALGFLCWLAGRWLPVDLDLPAVVLLLGGILCGIMTFARCPCCGHMSGDWNGPHLFFWRGYECPVCGFMPDWGR